MATQMVGHVVCHGNQAICFGLHIGFGSFWSFALLSPDFDLEQFRIKCERDQRNVKTNSLYENIAENVQEGGCRDAHARKLYEIFKSRFMMGCRAKQID